MARTYRDKLNHKRREKRRSFDLDAWRNSLPGDYSDYDPSDPINHYPRLRGGNMIMAPSRCGIWSDERPQSGRDRDQQRRNQKRRERQSWRKDALDNLDSD